MPLVGWKLGWKMQALPAGSTSPLTRLYRKGGSCDDKRLDIIDFIYFERSRDLLSLIQFSENSLTIKIVDWLSVFLMSGRFRFPSDDTIDLLLRFRFVFGL